MAPLRSVALAPAAAVALLLARLVYVRWRIAVAARQLAGNARSAPARMAAGPPKSVAEKVQLELEVARLQKEIARRDEVQRVHSVVDTVVPEGATVGVISRGDPDLVDLGARVGLPFPHDEDGLWSGHHPKDSAAAIDLLQRFRDEGGQFLVIPSTAGWWLDFYEEFRDNLAEECTLLIKDWGCRVYDLTGSPGPAVLDLTQPATVLRKVFVIGLTQTGTDILHRALTILGYKNFHYGGAEAYRRVLAAKADGRRLLEYVGEGHDSYSDVGSISENFDLIAQQYPGSRFILTVRDLDDWLRAREAHVRQNIARAEQGLYTGRNLQIEPDAWRAEWAQHVDRVHQHFRDHDPEDLLVLDPHVEGWQRLCAFLGVDPPDRPFPRRSARATAPAGPTSR